MNKERDPNFENSNKSVLRMSTAKVIELISEGSSIEAAVESAAAQASKTLSNVKQVYIKDIEALVENGQVAKYRVNAHVTFVLK